MDAVLARSRKSIGTRVMSALTALIIGCTTHMSFLACILISGIPTPVAAQSLDRNQRLVKPDAAGNRLYIVYLRPEMGQLNAGMTREALRQTFVGSGEFVNDTVAPIMNETCTTV